MTGDRPVRIRERTRIRELLDDAEISIADFADLVGITEKSMSNYYYGWRNPGKRLALNMAKILDVDVWYLLGYDSEQEDDEDDLYYH